MDKRKILTYNAIFLLLVLVLMGSSQVAQTVNSVRIDDIEGNTGNQTSMACTIFSVAIGDTVLFGNNEDYRFSPDTSFISFVPPQAVPNTINLPIPNATLNIYGLTVVGSIVDGLFFVQGGMNDQGLCYDINSIPPEPLNEQTGDLWTPLSGHWDLLWVCSTVDEVIDWYQTYKYPSTSDWNAQFNYVDATGDAVIVTVTNGEISFVEKGYDSYLVSTNFNRANVSSHYFDYPCWRYDTAVNMLEDIKSEENLTVEACRDILDAVHFEKNLFNDIETLYSTVYDPVNTKIHLYFLHDFTNVVTFDLEEEYSKVDPVSTNYSLQYKLADISYIMRGFFPPLGDTGIDYLAYGIVIGIPILVVVTLVVIWHRRRSSH